MSRRYERTFISIVSGVMIVASRRGEGGQSGCTFFFFFSGTCVNFFVIEL